MSDPGKGGGASSVFCGYHDRKKLGIFSTLAKRIVQEACSQHQQGKFRSLKCFIVLFANVSSATPHIMWFYHTLVMSNVEGNMHKTTIGRVQPHSL